ncbi:immunity protein [Mycobacterium phage Centaur]|uniref:Uncharacterized protein n=1 Tax=Mycobacterium phage Centaur TaxID=2488784 RepID=A0A3G8FF72_9CAUD|nr:immunity protein [Mycobacterium phage Centaur]AZF93389.1 hypothetical protein SEA_CENTAUR_4 [Mycobacterium phage Centaur]
MVTFDEARAIVAARRGPEYPEEAEFTVATWGYETATEWIIRAGSYPEVYGPRTPADFRLISTEDGPQITVNKETGEYRESYGIPDDEELTPVGEKPVFGPPPGQ